MDRFWAILQWVILLAVIIGILRFSAGANALGKTFFGWVFGESQLLAGLSPNVNGAGGSPSYATNTPTF